jgi:hypothetical protein
LVAACGGGGLPTIGSQTATPSGQQQADPDFVALAARSLNLPSASASNCPVTAAQLLSPTQPMTLGDGPIYATGLGSSSTLRVSPDANDSRYQFGTVTLTAMPDFSGKVLVRGQRIDQSGALAFYYPVDSNGPATPVLALDTAGVAQAGYWSSWYSDVLVASPGCYAVQVDTHDKSQVIVFLAEPATQ